MREYPILFNSEMVKAILEGRKTQTRRVCKPQPHSVGDICSTNSHETLMIRQNGADSWEPIPCPYGVPGDLLWVRETWADLPALREYNFPELPCTIDGDSRIIYRASTCERDEGALRKYTEPRSWLKNLAWKPSIHMSRKHSRILLEVTDVRVERVQEITEEDARAEGLRYDECNHLDPDGFTAKDRFETLWDSIYEKRGFGWEKNPWVWVVTFKRVA